MNTYSIHFTHGRSAVTLINIEADSSGEAWQLIQEEYAGQKCVLLSINQVF